MICAQCISGIRKSLFQNVSNNIKITFELFYNGSTVLLFTELLYKFFTAVGQNLMANFIIYIANVLALLCVFIYAIDRLLG